MTELLRHLQWQSRRGILELDLLLDKFWRHHDNLSPAQLQAMATILSFDDARLWHLLHTDAREPALNTEGQALLQRLRNL